MPIAGLIAASVQQAFQTEVAKAVRFYEVGNLMDGQISGYQFIPSGSINSIEAG